MGEDIIKALRETFECYYDLMKSRKDKALFKRFFDAVMERISNEEDKNNG